MVHTKLSHTMIRALLDSLARRLDTPAGYAYQVDSDRWGWSTVTALAKRAMAVMESREAGTSGNLGQYTGTWLTEDGATFLRQVLEDALRYAPENRPSPYREWLAEGSNADMCAAFLLGDDVSEVHTAVTAPQERLPVRETLSARDGISRFGDAIRTGRRIDRERRGGFTVTTGQGARLTLLPTAGHVDLDEVTRRFLDTMDSITHTNNTADLTDLMHCISRELWPVIVAHKLAPRNAAFILTMDEAATTTHLHTLADLGRRASEIWEALIQRELQRRADAGEPGGTVTYRDAANARKALLAGEVAGA